MVSCDADETPLGSSPATQDQLVAQLRQLGVKLAAPLMVHASLRAIGPIDGGGHTLLHTLREAIGAEGTLLMVLGADADDPFDALRTPVDTEDMGMLPELFRGSPGVQVNDHPAARFAAWGPDSAHLLRPIPVHDYFGPNSVLSRFTDMGGSVLRLGANRDTVTLTHWAEYLADLPEKRRVRRRYVRADIGEQWIESLDDSDGIVQWADGDYFSQILADFIALGHARAGPVGQCAAELLDGRTFVQFAVNWMERSFGATNG